MKLLDCFCGLGGVSDGFALEGFDVTGIDIEDMPSKGYKHKFIQADIRDLKGQDFRGYDVIWGSPPCRDFSQMSFVGKGSIRRDGTHWAWKNPPDPKNGLVLVNAFLNFIEAAKPTFWIMENSHLLQRHLTLKAHQVSNIQRTMKRAFWGNYPDFLMPSVNNKTLKWLTGGANRSWLRAKIPLACSRAFARAIREDMESWSFTLAIEELNSHPAKSTRGEE
jgi:site-specific DNA-cytosine methylase